MNECWTLNDELLFVTYISKLENCKYIVDDIESFESFKGKCDFSNDFKWNWNSFIMFSFLVATDIDPAPAQGTQQKQLQQNLYWTYRSLDKWNFRRVGNIFGLKIRRIDVNEKEQ